MMLSYVSRFQSGVHLGSARCTILLIERSRDERSRDDAVVRISVPVRRPPRLRSVYILLIERGRDERGRDDNGVHLGSARCTEFARRAKPRRLLSIILCCHLPSHDFYSDYHFDTLQEDVVSRNPCLLKRFSFCDSNFESVFLFERLNTHVRNIQHRQVSRVVSFEYALLLFRTCVDVIYD